MFNIKNHIPIILVAIMLSISTGCSQIVGIFPAQPNIKSGNETKDAVKNELLPVLAAMLGDGEPSALVQYVSFPCTTADGFGGPPKCNSGEADGTTIRAFPISDAEGYFVRPEEIDRVFDFTVESLYAVYQPTSGIDPEEYWPTGEFALLFEREIENFQQPVIVFVESGKIVRLGFSYGVSPETLLGQVSPGQILISPAEASTLIEQAN